MNKEMIGGEVSVSENQRLEIETIFNNALDNQLPLAIWRKPLSSTIYLAMSLSKNTEVEKYELENLGSGFLFCPFATNDHVKNHFIKNDILISFECSDHDKAEIKKSPAHADMGFLLKNSREEAPKSSLYFSPVQGASNCADRATYQDIVAKAVKEISEGKMSKVVPARCKAIDMHPDYSILSLFEALEGAYPNAFVYIVGIPGVGTWIGATPENLISVDENNIFKTTSLAGTQKFAEGTNLSEVGWRQKEIEEQAHVSRYIISCLKKIRIREYEEIGPKTIKAGNLIHLKSDFIINLNEVSYPFLPTVMLNLLHPTSAVCGTPKEASMDFILREENFERSYFSGFLGPVNIEDNTNLFVNLRCMQILQNNKAMVYAGAGVTIDSSPEKEWEETEMKMETLLEKIKK